MTLRDAVPPDPLEVHSVRMNRIQGVFYPSRNLIFLSDQLSPAESAFGEAHMRFHAQLAGGDCAEADQAAAAHLIPSVKLMTAALRNAATAVDAAVELGVAVHVLEHRLEGLADVAIAAGLWSEVEWPPMVERIGFECLTADMDVELASRNAGLRIVA